jgi:hypothetical protein
MLSILTSKPKVRNFLVYDLEWIPGKMEIRIIGVYDGNRYRSYTKMESFIENELIKSNRGKWFYAHAGGLADVQFVFDFLIHNRKHLGISIEASFSGSSAIIVRVTKHKHSWVFVDSYWLLRDKLANIAKWIGLEKGGPLHENEDATEEEKREWYATVPFLELREYNAQDCIILWKAIDQFQDYLLSMGGQLNMTLASSAMGLFRRKYLNKNIETSNMVNDISKKSYTASRVEVFQREVTNSNYYDINSSFPYSMTFPCPGEYLGTFSTIPDNTEDILYTADVLVSIPEMGLPTTPLRIKGRVFFPTGEWRAWLTSVDIELLLLEGGKILKVYECLCFAPFDDLREYSLTIFEHRKNSTNEFERTGDKLLMNAVYGKFAESPYKQGMSINPSLSFFESVLTPQLLMPGVFMYEKEVYIPHRHVPISAHITALSRKALFNFMKGCIDYHYCDTDGFSTTETMDTGKDIGELKHEKIIEDGIFYMPKLYKIKGKTVGKNGEWEDMEYIKAKGFSRMENDNTRFADLLEGKAVDYERMTRIRENLRNGVTKPNENIIQKRLRVLSIHDPNFNPSEHVVPKRFTYPDGFTRAWTIEELRKMLKDED